LKKRDRFIVAWSSLYPYIHVRIDEALKMGIGSKVSQQIEKDLQQLFLSTLYLRKSYTLKMRRISDQEL